jgi:small basic protein (TIGR04137 family)
MKRRRCAPIHSSHRLDTTTSAAVLVLGLLNCNKLTVCNQPETGYSLRSFFTGNSIERKFMSQHRSLRAASTLGGKRNVLKRFERTELLKKRGQWKDGDRITGLRKTKPEV